MMMMPMTMVSMMRMIRMVLQLHNDDDVGMHEDDNHDYDSDQCR